MLSTMHRWILRHDDSRIFIFSYVILAVVLAIWLGLFWLAVVVGVHFVFEIIKEHHRDPRWPGVFGRALWELKLDFGLVVFGLVIGLYLEVVLGAAGIAQAGRAGAQTAIRFGLWERVLRGVLLSLDDVALVVKETAARARGAGMTGDGVEVEVDVEQAEPRPARQPLTGADYWGDWVAPRWSLGARLSLGFTGLCVAMVLAAPLLPGHTVSSVVETVLEEMHPFPGGDGD